MSHVFISYVRENESAVKRLCGELERGGVEIWLDRNEIAPGVSWKDAIRKAIKEGAFFIACFSKEYQSKYKSYMNEELTLAIEEMRQLQHDHVWFIPVLLSETDVPARDIGGGRTLLDYQYVPLYQDWNEGVRRILSAINPPEKDALRKKLENVARKKFQHSYIYFEYEADNMSPDDDPEDDLNYQEWSRLSDEYIELMKKYKEKYLEEYDPYDEKYR